MNEQNRRTLVCLILDALKVEDSWCGETHIQKAAYLAKAMFGIPLEEYDFVLYRYGPYSSELTWDLVLMRNLDMVAITPKYPYGASYATKEKEDISSDLSKKYGEKINFIAKKFGSNGVGYLEKLCTAHWIVASEKYCNKTPEEQAKYLSEIKTHILLEAANQSIQNAKEMIEEAKRVA